MSTYRVIGTVTGGLWGFLMYTIGLNTFKSIEGTEGSGVFVSLVSPLVVVSTTYLAYKRGLDQLARFIQVGVKGWKVWGVLGIGLSACLELLRYGNEGVPSLHLPPWQLTYILVGYGSYPNASSAILLALVRISGIVAGGVVSLIFAVLILPRSANVEACK